MGLGVGGSATMGLYLRRYVLQLGPCGALLKRGRGGHAPHRRWFRRESRTVVLLLTGYSGGSGMELAYPEKAAYADMAAPWCRLPL